MKANDTKASETQADIVAEMRHGFDQSWHDIDREWVHSLPDRIEAAAKREAEGMREVMNIEELESVVDAMAEEGGDQIDALYDTVTLQKDQYCGFICRLREVVRQMKLHNEDRKAAVGSGNSTTAVPGASPSVLETVGVYHNPPNAVNVAAMREALEAIVKVGYPHNFQHEAPHISGYCYEITDAITKCLEALAAPPHTGKWMNGRKYEYEYAYCSACGRMQWADWNSHREAEDNIEDFADNYKFCPGCGAKMEGGVYVK